MFSALSVALLGLPNLPSPLPLLPFGEQGDRKEGKRVALMVKTRRQATGMFYEDKPPIIKIG